MKERIALFKCRDYDFDLVYFSLQRVIELLGGIEKFIKPKSKVLLKPNLLLGISPQKAVTTHPQIIRAVIRILKTINCEIYLGDSCSAWVNAKKSRQVYAETGIEKLAHQEDIKLVEFNNFVWKQKFPLTSWLDFCDYFISLPKFKTHDLMLLTGAVKNLFGLISGPYKIELHRRYFYPQDFAKVLVDIYEIARPALTIIDGVWALEGDGPGTNGIPKNTGFILAGKDAVAIDSVLALIMGLKPLDIFTNREADIRKLGVTELKEMEILGDNIEEFIDRKFKLPSTSLIRKVPSPFIALAKKMIRLYPSIKYKDCVRCGACVAICPAQAIGIKGEKISIDYAQCINCFCCQEACIHGAMKVKRSILAKILGL